MYKIVFAFVAAAILTGYVTAGPVFAQSGMLVATIPFDFHVGDKPSALPWLT